MKMTGVAESFLVPDRVALITGGGSGIGQECAIVLALAGAKVIATDVNESGLEETQLSAREQGVEIEIQTLDVSNPVAVTEAVDQIIDRHGRLDILVNSAGVMVIRPVLEVTPEELARVMSINLNGTFFACQAAGRVMGEGGRIINVASAI